MSDQSESRIQSCVIQVVQNTVTGLWKHDVRRYALRRKCSIKGSLESWAF